MKLTILGCGICIVKADRKGPAFLLEVADELLLFDCGWGFGENMLNAGFDVNALDHIFISHPHADHMGSLTNILQSMFVSSLYFPKTARTKPLFLHGYKGFKNDYEQLRSIMFPERKEPYSIHVYEHAGEEKKFAPFVLKSSEVHHAPTLFHSVAYRVECGNTSFVYSGDCSFDERLVHLSKDADLLILDCSTPHRKYQDKGPQPNHLSPYECGVIAQKAHVKKLVPFHMYYDFTTKEEVEQEIRKNYSNELFIPHDLQRIEV